MTGVTALSQTSIASTILLTLIEFCACNTPFSQYTNFLNHLSEKSQLSLLVSLLLAFSPFFSKNPLETHSTDNEEATQNHKGVYMKLKELIVADENQNLSCQNNVNDTSYANVNWSNGNNENWSEERNENWSEGRNENWSDERK
ncbi:hypothetical protein MTR_0098s0030 [Medicago truncatula]|uniref:Uncharacterized protein n=1 Tax=Medicago truncatula TaxID=3880 RepID=A0A072TGR9_MEDTR|nr:hypothetical protein MTR_0098s0030 [Medicago truncatula]